MVGAKQSPSLLWHYTTFEGLRGIVTESELFASSLAYLNDAEEFQYTIEALLSLLEEEQKRGTPLAGLIYENVPEMVKSVFDTQRERLLFVACFSEERDDLSQWRSYTPRPPGFAIGFLSDELRSLATSFGFEMLGCRYPEADQLRAVIKAAYDAATVGMDDENKALPIPATGTEHEKFIEKWGYKIVEAVIELAKRNKHPKFAAEKEVRLIGNLIQSIKAGNQFKVDYRLSGSLIVPYVKIPARSTTCERPSPIKEILVGPCPHQDAVIEVVRQMCIQYDIKVQVDASAIPYRNW
jgi:hypothetical protein